MSPSPSATAASSSARRMKCSLAASIAWSVHRSTSCSCHLAEQMRRETKMAGRLKDKVAIVVGAGSSGPGWGNGKCTAVTFAREGAKVLCVDRKRAAAEETVGLIAKEGGEAVALRGRCLEERRREGDGRCLPGQVGPHRRPRQQCRHRLDRRAGRAQRGRVAPGVRRQREELLPDRQARAAGHGEAGQGRDRERELDRLDPHRPRASPTSPTTPARAR